MLFIIRIMCYVVQSCICLGIPDSHIIHSRDFPVLKLAVLVATLLAGMKFCESYVVATVGLYIEQESACQGRIQNFCLGGYKMATRRIEVNRHVL